MTNHEKWLHTDIGILLRIQKGMPCLMFPCRFKHTDTEAKEGRAASDPTQNRATCHQPELTFRDIVTVQQTGVSMNVTL